MPGTATHEPVPRRPANTAVAEPLPVPPVPVPPPSPLERESSLSTARIEDLLGPARDRYFGEGYRRVGHELRDVVIDLDPDGAGGVSALAWIGYPADWAVKRPGVDLRPHVSSLDTLVIGAQLCEAFLVHRYCLDPGQRRRMWLRRIDAKAGQRPQEELAGFEVTARLRDVRRLENRPGTYASTFDCRIGSMRLRCEVGHEMTVALPRPGRYVDIGQVLGPAARRYYGSGYRDRRYELRDVGVDSCNSYAECVVQPLGGGAPAPGCDGAPASIGLEAEYQPCVTMAESIMMTAQLSEVILYRTDGLDRSRSNTMWLRSLRMERPDPPARQTGAEPGAAQSNRAPFTGSIAVSKSRVVELGGARWRIVDMVAYCEGIEQTHSLAHELPASADSCTGSPTGSSTAPSTALEPGPELGIMRPDMAHHGGFE